MSNNNGAIYSMEVQQLNEELAAVTGYYVTEERMRIIAEFFDHQPSIADEVFVMLRNEGYNDVGYYFSSLPLDRIKANGFNTTKMNNEIAFMNQTVDISSIVAGTFERGRKYSKKEVKETLQGIYDGLGLNRTAKATDLPNYVECEQCKKDGIKAIRIK